MELDLSDKTAIVTGAGRGIGETIAETFAEAGANVATAARTQSEIEATVERVEAHGVDGLAVPADLTDVDEMEAFLDATIDEFGVPEILVNNAGANIPAHPADQPLEEIDRMIDINFRALYLLSRRYGRAFGESGHDDGRIINISSVLGHIGFPATTLYGGTKSGIFGLTRGLALAFAGDGIRVNSVSPSITRIQRIDDLLEERGDDLFDFDRLPLGRIAVPQDVADACLFLASEKASFITGADIPVDGGIRITAGFYTVGENR